MAKNTVQVKLHVLTIHFCYQTLQATYDISERFRITINSADSSELCDI